MFTKNTIIFVLCMGLTMPLQPSFKVAISAQDFHDGNSVVLIARDVDGLELVAGYVPLLAGKTEFSFDEIAFHDQNLSSISDQKSVVVTDVKVDCAKKDEDLIYLYFEVDAKVNIVRAIVIRNTLFADQPFDVIEISTTSMLDEDEEDFDFFSDAYGDDELSQLDLTDIQVDAPAELSWYDKTVLSMYALWAIKSAQIKQSYKNFVQWLNSRHAA